MSEISAAAVKSLRDRTGAGMMDCKRALEEADGDEEHAIQLLRKKGAATAAKRAERETSEGVVKVAGAGDEGPLAMVELTCETDFVARNDEFIAFAERAARVAREADLPAGEVVDGEELLDLPDDDPLRQELNALRAKIGENLRLDRVVRYEPADDGHVGSYVHFGDKIGVLVELIGVESGAEVEALARDLAMHIAATDPVGVSPEDIPEEEREKERQLLEEQAREEDKPDHVIEQIVEGRMRKYYEQNALLRQAFVKDPDRTVGELIEASAPGAEVGRFVRFDVGA